MVTGQKPSFRGSLKESFKKNTALRFVVPISPESNVTTSLRVLQAAETFKSIKCVKKKGNKYL